ncbi:MAG: hypothetical protein H6865_03210 [Rhodospirillales bacterium]|nr:hypothetical protein [Alphaproteobacteria bacterium]MCB9986627.1 hypothetical protein [Rhodospirillales bacterium]USO06844.1 MAG: hypothetical protein H6866_05175 [Rhodospirillales bacterium]
MMRTLYLIFALLLALPLAACGLTPVYGKYAGGTHADVAAKMDQVYIAVMPDRRGQSLRNELMDRFYRTGRKNRADAPYALSVDRLTESSYGLGIAKDATATRSQLKLSGTLRLTRADGAVVLTRALTAISSFNTLSSQYTTLVTENDARDQAVRDMAGQVTALVELYFSNPAAYQPGNDRAITGYKDKPETAAERLHREHDLDTEYTSTTQNP